MLEHRRELADKVERSKSWIIEELTQRPYPLEFEKQYPVEFIRFVLQKMEDVDRVIANLRADTVTVEEAFNASLIWPKPAE
jgi:hypothetical protein